MCLAFCAIIIFDIATNIRTRIDHSNYNIMIKSGKILLAVGFLLHFYAMMKKK